MKNIYLDYAAATPVDARVLRKMMPYLRGNFGNPSSIHKFGAENRKAIEDARKIVASQLGCRLSEIIFTSSGTEANNLALSGIMNNHSKRGHLVISSIEHKSIMAVAKRLEQERHKVTRLKVDRFGLVNLKELDNALGKGATLVSIIYANNEIGTIQNIKVIASLVKRYKKYNNYPLLHIDACQAPGLIEINVNKLGIDLMTLNGAKIYGPKGVGVLYRDINVNLSPMILGGGQEMGMRSGTENVATVVGFAEALKIVENSRENSVKLVEMIRDYAIKKLREIIPNIMINGHSTYTLPTIINVCMDNISSERLVLSLSKKGIYISSGSACATNDNTGSYVLKAIGLKEKGIQSSIRISISKHTTRHEIDALASALRVEYLGK
ncbi:MAG: Cysteine desulfurase NifS [Candidatus Yanofskybacteria bacterium GW2011_GWD2_39_48]|uniref:Cysteine desulfurase NifS n=1 Tax=Candidatus Yanofskybacteria bacterium GW2011_GWD2_39_48 TaxID=1619031 RepID=A0A0G0RN66_9BACT|nr:MAG: Cysteine desulfurase NifS [Candidatus Yanofskybacteria bacterium GW2011_GWD2_39_48]